MKSDLIPPNEEQRLKALLERPSTAKTKSTGTVIDRRLGFVVGESIALSLEGLRQVAILVVSWRDPSNMIRFARTSSRSRRNPGLR